MEIETTEWHQQCIERERDRVALMLADPLEIDAYLPGIVGEGVVEHFWCQSYWRDRTLHALFCLLCELRAAGEPLGYINRLTVRGKELLAQRATADNTDRLGL